MSFKIEMQCDKHNYHVRNRPTLKVQTFFRTELRFTATQGTKTITFDVPVSRFMKLIMSMAFMDMIPKLKGEDA